jgi:hypothetical protein
VRKVQSKTALDAVSSGPIMPQLVHRPTVFNRKKRNPFGEVFLRGESRCQKSAPKFPRSKNSVENFLVSGFGFVVRNVSEEFPHGGYFLD